MHVFLLTENWPPRIGGIENYLTHIAGNLPTQSVTVVVPPWADTKIDGKDNGIRAVIARRWYWSFIKPAWLPLFIATYRQLRRENVDIVLCGKALCEGLIGYYLKKYLGIPYVVFTYAMEIETWAGKAKERRKLERVLQYADRIIYINEVTKQKLLALGARAEQLVKIWPGVDEQYFVKPVPVAQQAILTKYGLKKPYLLTVGRLIERKGIDVLIEAFVKLDQTKFSELQLVIVGEGPEKDKLVRLATQHFMQTSVRFLGHVSVYDLPSLYAGAEIFLLTPRPIVKDEEGFGIVYLEAAAAGTPAIATNSGGAREAVQHQITGLIVRPNDVTGVREAIVQLLNQPHQRDKLAQAARTRAWEQFRWAKRILLVKGVIDAVVATRSRALAKI